METKPLKAWNAGWHSELDEVIANQEALRVDALGSTRPIRAKAETPAEINELFDGIAYNKGAAVLRMVEGYVGAEAFRAGVNAYIEQFKYGNARAEDFWTVMTRTSGKPVDKVMSRFVDQPGVPLLSLALQCAADTGAMSMSQTRYLQLTQSSAARAEQWDIPACVRLPDRTSQCEPLDTNSGKMTLAGCPAWVMGNADGLGYYRVGYPAEMVRAIAAHLTALTPAERLSLLADERALVRAGKHDVSVELDLATGLSADRQNVVVGALIGTLGEIEDDFTTDESRAKYRQWVKRLLDPIFADVGWTGSPGDPVERKKLRANLVGALGEIARDPAVLTRARALTEQLMKDPTSVDPELRDTVVFLAPIGGDRALYDKYVAAAQAAKTPDERYRYLAGLTRFSDPVLITRTLEMTLSADVRPQDVPQAVGGLLSNRDGHDVAWTGVSRRWADLQKKVGPFLGGPALVGPLGTFCSTQKASEIRAFFAAHPIPEAQRTLQQALESIEVCAAVRAAQAPVLAEWLKTR
jgi:aminopeptidase N